MPAASDRTPIARKGGALRNTAAICALACTLAGCGSSGSGGTGADPASVVPAATPLYAGATVRPTGALQAAAREAGQKLTHQADPYLRLTALLMTPGSPDLDFKRDVSPWLGEEAGIFIGSAGGSVQPLLGGLGGQLFGGSGSVTFPFTGGAQGAIVLDTSDLSKARAFLDQQAARAGAGATSYRGVAYRANSAGVSFAIVDRFAVIGSQAAVHAVIDTHAGGPSLARAGTYSALQAKAPAGALAHVFANSTTVAAVASQSGVRGASALSRALFGTRGLNASLVPSSGSLALDLDALLTGGPGAGGATNASALFSGGASAARAAGEAPGDSWLAVGLGQTGPALGPALALVEGVGALGAPSSSTAPALGLSVNGVLEAILSPLRPLGADSAQARRDYQSWMGAGALFAAGTGLLELKAGTEIVSNAPAASRAAVAKLGAALRKTGASVQPASIPGTDAAIAVRVKGLPLELAIANGAAASGQTKFVIGLGQASVTAALHPTSTLSSSSSYAAAGSLLGEGIQPSVLLEVPTLLSLLEAIGLTADPSIAPVLPYARSLTTVAGGSKEIGGGVARLRVVLGLRQ
jgi:hypothetical protein